MKLAFVLDAEGYIATKLRTACEITLEARTITNAHLKLKVRMPEINKEAFDDIVANSGKNCLISKLLEAKITIDAELV